MRSILIHNCQVALSRIYSYCSTPAILLLVGLLCVQTVSAAGRPKATDLPLPVRVVLSRANPWLMEKKYDQAIEALIAFQARAKAIPKPGAPDPKGYHHAEIYYTLGNGYLLQKKYELAATAFKRAVARDDTHSYAWLNLAKANYELDRFAQAGNAFRQGYQTAQEKNPQHLYFSAAAYLMAAKFQRSIETFDHLLLVHPAAVKPEWKAHLVHALLADDQPRRAMPHIRELVRVYSGKKQIQWQEILLHQYVQLNMRKDALDYAQFLARNAPMVAKWWKALAHIQLNENKYEDALAALTIYAFLTPLSIAEKKLLADLNLQVGIPVKAAEFYESCLDAKEDQDMIKHLVTAYRRLGCLEKAIDCIDRFEPASDNPELLLIKGELLYALEKYDQATDVYRKAARYQGPHIGQAWLMAGFAAWQRNDIAASKTAFVRASDYKKEKKAANKALNQLAVSFPGNPSNNMDQEAQK